MATTAGYTPPDESRDAEQTLLCDDPGGGAAPIKFWRRVAYTADGFVESTADVGLDGQQYNIVGTVVDCSETIDTVLPPQQFCFDTVVPETTEQIDGRRFTATLNIRPGFEVFEVQWDTSTVPLRISWIPTDTDGSFFAEELTTGLQVSLPGSTVTVTPGPTAGLCDDEPTPFTIDIACIERADAPTYGAIRYDGGQDLIQNPGLALTAYNPPLPNGQQWTATQRQSDGGNMICTDMPPAGADTGWQTNDPAQTFELWPRWRQDGVPSSGNGGNFDYYAVTPNAPRNGNVIELNSTAPDGIVFQTFTVDQPGTFRISATFGGREETQTIGVRLYDGDVTPTLALPGDRLDVSIDAPNVVGLGGPADPPNITLQRFPWTEYQDTALLDAGTYTLAVIGPPTGTGSGGLLTDLRVLTNSPDEQFITPLDDCQFDRVVPATVDRDCQQHQPVVDDDGVVTAWRNVETGTLLDNAAFWAQDPPPGCCDPLPADEDTSDGPTTQDVARPSTEYVTEVCGVLNGRAQPLFRRVDISSAGVLLRETFIGPNGAVVSPSSWEPGLCTSPGDEDQTAHMLEVTPANEYNLVRSAAIGGDVTAFAFTVLEGEATVTDSDGTTITAGLPVGYSASWDSGGPATQLAQPIRITTTGRVIVTERHRVAM